MDVIDQLDAVASEGDFCRFADGSLQVLLPHRGFVCGIADSIAEWRPHVLLNHGFPVQYLGAIRQVNQGYNSEMIERWRDMRQPVPADPSLPKGRWWSDGWMAGAVAAGLQWLCLGKTNAEISTILGTSVNNVKYHLKSIFAKLGVTSRTQAVAKSMTMKLVQ